MYRWITIPCLVIGVVLFPLSLAMMQEYGSTMFVPLALSCLLMIFAFTYDSRKEKQHKENAEAIAESRITDLTSKPWPFDKSMEVKCRPSGFVAILGTLFFGLGTWGLFESASQEEVLNLATLVGAGFFCLLALTMMYKLVAESGDRHLVLRSKGISGLGFGYIPWAEIEGVDYTKATIKTSTIHTITFLVPRLPNALDPRSAHPLKRLVRSYLPGSMRTKLVFSLEPEAELPIVVDKVAHFLWKEATQREFPWIPDASPELNRLYREQSELMAQFPDPDRFSEMANSDISKAEMELERIKQVTAKYSANQQLIHGEIRKRMRLTNWVLGIFLATFFFLILNKLFLF